MTRLAADVARANHVCGGGTDTRRGAAGSGYESGLPLGLGARRIFFEQPMVSVFERSELPADE
jgi:hypothetical protein